MDTAIIVAIIGAVTTIITCIVTAICTNKLTQHKIDELTQHVKEHNGYAKMFYESKLDIECIKKDIEFLKNKEDKQ